MKHIHKHFPPQLAQMVVIDKNTNDETLEKFITTDRPNSDEYAVTKINGTDYNLFLWLIYNTHKIYSDKKLDNPTLFKFEYEDVRATLKDFDTQSIKKSIERLNQMEFIFNYCRSYGDKDYIIVKPFKIKIIESEKKRKDTNISFGFSVKTTDEFMEWFNKPKPLVDVNYSVIFGLNRMTKLLYLFLRDAYGGYKNTVRHRKVNVQMLKNLMNVHNGKASNTDFIKELRKSKTEINKHSDLTIQKMNVVKERDLKSGISEIVEVKFEMMVDKDKIYTIKTKKKKSENDNGKTEKSFKKKKVSNDSISTNTVEKPTVNDAVSLLEKYKQYAKKFAEDEFQRHIKYGKKIDSPKAYKAKIEKSIIEDEEVKSQFQLKVYLDDVKSELKEQIDDNQPYMIVFRSDKDNPYYNFSFNDEYQLVNSFGDISTNTIDETIEYIENNVGEGFEFEIERCMDINRYSVGLI